MTIDIRVTTYILIIVAVLLMLKFIIIPRLKDWYHHNKILSWGAIGLCCAVLVGVLTPNYNHCSSRNLGFSVCIEYSFKIVSYDLKQLF